MNNLLRGGKLRTIVYKNCSLRAGTCCLCPLDSWLLISPWCDRLGVVHFVLLPQTTVDCWNLVYKKRLTKYSIPTNFYQRKYKFSLILTVIFACSAVQVPLEEENDWVDILGVNTEYRIRKCNLGVVQRGLPQKDMKGCGGKPRWHKIKEHCAEGPLLCECVVREDCGGLAQ